MIAFKAEESMQFSGYKITFTPTLWNRLEGITIDSSWNLLYARLFGLSYPEFLRYIRDTYNATLWGKSGYICFYFKERVDAQQFISVANRRFNLWMKL